MKPTTFTNAVCMPAAGASRLRADLGRSAYPWQIAISDAGAGKVRSAVVITDTKHRFRWPGDPSS